MPEYSLLGAKPRSLRHDSVMPNSHRTHKGRLAKILTALVGAVLARKALTVYGEVWDTIHGRDER